MDTPFPSTDAELLRSWSAGRCEAAFRQLVGKYLGLVRGLALRRTGNGTLAEEIAQTVFTRLALKAGHIQAEPTLAPWLHHCAWCETTSALRRESTRRRHMHAYADHLQSSPAEPPASLPHAALLYLDEALGTLRGDDQRIVLMRFYEGRGLRDIAGALGKTEAAVRKQGQRALEKMARCLKRRGTAVTATALAAGLGATLSQPAGAASAALISTTAAASVTTGAKLTLLHHVLALMNTKTKTALLTAACMAVPLIWQWERASGMEDRLSQAEKDAAKLKTRAGFGGSGGGRLAGTSRSGPASGGGLAGKPGAGVADWEAALKSQDPLLRSRTLASLMASLTPESAPGVAELFTRLRKEPGGSQYEVEQRHFLRAWGQLDGQAALASCADKDGAPNSSTESLAALAGWAQASPDKARAWLDSLPAGDTRKDLAFGLIDGWSLQDFDAASAFATSEPRSTMRDQIRSLLLQRALASGGVPEAQRWFDAIPGDEHNSIYKQRAFDELVSTMLTRDPSGAARWISSMGRQSFMSGDGIPEVAAGLAASSPGEALRWLEAMGNGEGEAAGKTKQGYTNVMDKWSQKEPQAAAAWLQEHPEHPAYDGMAASLAAGVAAQDGPAGIAWADSIRDPDARAAARDKAAEAMLLARGDDAKADLLAAGYTEDRISKLSNVRSNIEFSVASTDGMGVILEQRALARFLEVQGRNETAAQLKLTADMLSVATVENLTSMGEQTRAATLDSPGYRAAHPNGVSAACASCHK